MTTTFLFANTLTDEDGLCLTIDQNNQLVLPAKQRTIAEIRQLQANSRTIVVLPCQFFSLYQVQLPWLGEKKARAALPYALEDQLAQNVENLHFAFDRQHYMDGRYLVAVCSRDYLRQVITKIDQCGLDFDVITLDWFALKNNESCVLPEYLLANHETFQGALGRELADLYLSRLNPQQHALYLFTDSGEPPRTFPAAIHIEEPSTVWLAKRLMKNNIMNLCQGDLAHGNAKNRTRLWYVMAGAMFAVWLISLITINAFKLHSLNSDMAEVDKKIAVIYHHFFPQAQQVISPRFRISQLLKGNQNGGDNTFWTLLNTLSEVTPGNESIIEQLRFQNKSIQVTLASKNFETLEALQNRLIQHKIKIKQTQASTRDDQVVSTLELSL
ncbi:type II secretion system protein GspL [Legionella spiritensis]|uniref:Type II secretion system protein L n=1 Tax=Legionella spiritensis TaxID=452 RepID=A0A0W0Z9D2_LEGSP|nr:type II secretion system protein GspL [Legionella spiritensis]KTD65697.1 general secretion pathway protein L [Legionella spiritensis]SNV43440.1 general secretion pathway protein L [Legionella spiritensis]